MRLHFYTLLLAIGLLLAGCGENQSSSDDVPPSAPRWVPRSPDDAYAQTGIRPEPVLDERQHWVRLEWYANPEPDVAGYRILRRGEWEGDPRYNYPVADLQVGIDIGTSGPYSWIDEGRDQSGFNEDLLAPDPNADSTRGYYWQMVAYDVSENTSPRSPSIYYRLVNNPSGMAVAGSEGEIYTLSWQFRANPDVILFYYYVFRVYASYWGPDSVYWYDRRFIYGNDGRLTLSPSDLARPFLPDCTYVWQINIVANSRSESHADSIAGAAVRVLFVAQN